MTDFSGWRRTQKNAVLFSFFISACVFLIFFSPVPASANNISVSSVSVSARDATNNTVTAQFNISWSNSWRNQENYDAAWVFMKYSTDGGTSWTHATLKTSGTNPSGFSIGSGTAIDIVVPTDKKGAFIQRSAIGSGSLSTTAVKFVWDYGTDGVSDSASVTLKVFGIEMVYIPAASFSAGDTSSTAAFKQGSGDTDPWSISSEGAISVTAASSDGYYYTSAGIAGEDATGSSFTIGASFPKGYAAFYLMKYEVTEGQWIDFFNTLTTAQKTERDITGNDVSSNPSAQGGKNSDSAVNRNTVSWSSGDASTSRTDRAIHYLSWQDGAAFTDWAALRPITELEFEKAARGTLSAVSGEYIWGNTTMTQAATLSGTEDGTETITTSSANATYTSTTYSGGDASTGPLRAGIFATSTGTRTLSGAGYYGNMELGGNVYERVVTVGNSTGRSFTGTHGDGALTTTSSYEGNATNTDWPGIDGTAARGVTGSAGSGFRGSGYAGGSTRVRISDRSVAAYSSELRSAGWGFRAARTA